MIKNVNMMNIFYFLLSFFPIINSQIIKNITLGESIKGSMNFDEGHVYYLLKIPKNINNKILVFTTHEENENENLNKEDDTLFSDPDFYVSKINKYPSSRLSSEWYSQRYGADIITIPSNSVHENDIFYIGIYCQFKCRYYLNSYVTFDIPISPNQGYILNIKPKETGNLKFHIDKEFDELKVIIHFRQKAKIRVLMSKEMPTTQNTFKVIPGWMYGYSIIVKKNTKEYCTNCDYHLFIKNEGKNTVFNVLILFIFQQPRFMLRKIFPLYDTMSKNTQRCYSFPIRKEEKNNEKLIIQLTMFSGKVDILFQGWNSSIIDLSQNIDGKITNIMDETFYYFDKKNFEIFDKNNGEKDKDSNFNFCIFSKFDTSFIITSYFLSNLEHFQQFRDINILLQGNSMKGYLLKDQVFKYDLLGSNLDKIQYDIETNITVKVKNNAGKVIPYAFYCKNENCQYKKRDLDKLIEENKLIKPLKKNAFGEYIIQINNTNNFCYKKENQIVPLNNINNNNECTIVILVHCNKTNDDGLCIYNIQLEIEDKPILMKPRQMYYGVIPIKKFDSYEIIITDENIYNLIIVLNTESGDAELKIKKGEFNWNSLNDDYIPDVIRITPKKINSDNLLGKYLINVYSKTFSTYHLYYYTTYKKENNNSTAINNFYNSDITMNINIGDIINDFFPIDIRYKIYSVSNIMNKKENIKIFLDKVNIGFKIYVFDDISNFKIKQLFEIIKSQNKEQIEGYKWKSNSNNEININLNEIKDFSPNQNLYIIIIPELKFNISKYFENKENNQREFNLIETVARKASIKYYLGVSTSHTPLMISEGIPHTMTLNDDYNGQLYYYIHFDLNKKFILEINLLFGEIDIYIDIKKISSKKITSLQNITDSTYNNENSLHFYKNIKSNKVISLNHNYFKKYLSESDKEANIFFYIKISDKYKENNKYRECQYNIIEKSSEQKEELLVPGQTRTIKLSLGNRQNFIVEEIIKRKNGNINVFFKNGYGNIYVRIPKIPEIDSINFPDESNYDFIGETIYSGKVVFIPEEIYQRINVKNFKLQILITVIAETSSDISNLESSSEITFSINYSNEPKKINQNEPYDGYIKKGELQYFQFYFDSDTKNIYIGLSNMKGDADMYLNYGENLPTPKKYNWLSNQINHEFIDINKDDDFFKKKNLLSINGLYTLLIIGYTDTSFSLFVSNHDILILPLRNNKKEICLCKEEGEKCYFRYTDAFLNQNKENGINYNEIIFTSNYLYGNGIMYTKVVKDDEINNFKNITNLFPNNENYDISNKESKQRTFLKYQIKEDKYTQDSNILLTYICQERTKVDITSTPIRYFKTTDFIEENKENIYYLGFDPNSGELIPEITLYFYNYDKKKDLIYKIHSYVGDAKVIVYSNNSFWDSNKQMLISDYKEIHNFEINSYNEQYSIIGLNPYISDYHNVIKIEEKEKFDNIIFKIIPKQKFSFYIQCYYDKNFMEIPFGKLSSFYAKNDEFYGYFDITEDYSDIEMNIDLEKNLKMSAELYVKINKIKLSESKLKPDKNESKSYSIPNEKNYDYKRITDNLIGSISLSMRNFPILSPQEQNSEYIRALFYIKINKKEFIPLKNEKNEYEINDNLKKDKNNEDKALINILITPGINNFKRVKANPLIYYFSNLTYNLNETKKIPETKIWELKKEKIGHDIMVIEISSCKGEYSFKIQDHLITGINNDVSLEFFEKKENGKHTIYVNNLKSNIYYLSIEAKESDVICKMQNSGKSNLNCGNDLSCMIYYYTDYENNIKISKIDKILTYIPYGKGKIKIELPEIIINNLNNKNSLSDFKFDVFATRKKEYFENLGNICFLSRFIPNETTIFSLEDMKIENKKSLIISGLNYRTQYYIGILIQNVNTRELIAFDPIIIWSGGYLPFPLWKTISVNVIIIGLILALIIYIKKYRNVKIEIKEIKGDALPKSEYELPSIGLSQSIQYQNINQRY